ncbi:hypothetical protein ACROYT_G014096 [Oculina patagonica]
MRDAIEDLGVPDGIDIHSIVPGQPTAMTKAALDAEYIRWLPPLVRTRPRPPGRRQRNNFSSRARRRAAYARTQRSFKKNRKRCAWDVLSGLWKEEPSPVPMAQQEPAPGPVDRTLNDLKDVWREELAAHFNLWLLADFPPAALRRGETVLISKESGTQGKHRLITLSDITIRCFHRVLAKRMEKDLPWNTRQKAFRSGDGVADSIWLLQNIIRQHQHTYKPLNIVFLDIKKAFDSVSHQSLILAAQRMGTPL